LTGILAERYLSNYLVFGKAVRFRHYPVTVNAERSSKSFDATGASALGRLLDLDEAQVRRPAR
jgi:hypothetical protein